VEARDVFDEGGLNGSGTVISLGFEWCSHQLETMAGRGRTEVDKTMTFGGSKGSAEKLLGRCRKTTSQLLQWSKSTVNGQ
jgi:hypothetical protein